MTGSATSSATECFVEWRGYSLDAFAGETTAARWGGEEFVVGMYSMPCHAAVKRLELALERLRAERFESDGAHFTMTFSAGVAEFPTDGTDWITLSRLAAEALPR